MWYSSAKEENGSGKMKNLNVMLKPASSLCNLRCKYCFYADVSDMREVKSFGMMREDTLQGILDNLQKDLDAGDHLHLAFQGGEPMLAGLSFYQKLVASIKGWKKAIHISYALQTNGILLDDAWCQFLKENNFLVGISLDILSECHDEVRIDPEGKGTFKMVSEAISCLEKHQVNYNVLCTLTGAVARYPKQVWKQIQKTNMEYVQFTPCLDELEGAKNSPYALTPKRFASFYIELFRLWLEDFKRGKYRSIKFFDDCVNLMMYGRPTSCGMNGACQPQLVIEADGTAYPCDFYCLDEYQLGNLAETGPLELLQSERVQAFLHRSHKMPELCKNCRYQRFCGGNCKRMQKEICCFGSDTYCGYQEFLDVCGGELQALARRYRNR